MDAEPLTTDVKGCARCGKNHPPLAFRPLSNPPEGITHFATCPETGEPILACQTATVDDAKETSKAP